MMDTVAILGRSGMWASLRQVLGQLGVYLALTGYQCDLVEGKVAFEPKISGEHFVGFWITGQGWGKYRQYRDPSTNELKQEFEVIYGEAPGRRQDGC